MFRDILGWSYNIQNWSFWDRELISQYPWCWCMFSIWLGHGWSKGFYNPYMEHIDAHWIYCKKMYEVSLVIYIKRLILGIDWPGWLKSCRSWTCWTSRACRCHFWVQLWQSDNPLFRLRHTGQPMKRGRWVCSMMDTNWTSQVGGLGQWAPNWNPCQNLWPFAFWMLVIWFYLTGLGYYTIYVW